MLRIEKKKVVFPITCVVKLKGMGGHLFSMGSSFGAIFIAPPNVVL